MHDGHVKKWVRFVERQNRKLHDAHIREWKKDRARIERWKTKHVTGHRLNVRMRVAIRKALLGQKCGRRWESIVGYTVEDLYKHLNRALPKGKTLDAVLKAGWHIDHIVPKSTYDLAKQTELAKAWCLSNLRMIPAHENWSKNDKRLFLL